MPTIRIYARIDLDQMRELLGIFEIQDTTDKEISTKVMHHGEYGTYHISYDREGNMTVKGVE